MGFLTGKEGDSREVVVRWSLVRGRGRRDRVLLLDSSRGFEGTRLVGDARECVRNELDERAEFAILKGSLYFDSNTI